MSNQQFGIPVIAIILAVLVYRNAKERNISAAVAWGILTFFLGIFGVAGYYLWVLRPNKKDS